MGILPVSTGLPFLSETNKQATKYTTAKSLQAALYYFKNITTKQSKSHYTHYICGNHRAGTQRERGDQLPHLPPAAPALPKEGLQNQLQIRVLKRPLVEAQTAARVSRGGLV